MNNFREKFSWNFHLLKNKLSFSIQNILNSNKKYITDILDIPQEKKIVKTPPIKKSEACKKNIISESAEKPNNLQPYSIEFLWEKIIVLWYQNSQEIYKIFPATGWNFIYGNQADQITALYQTHKRAFFKKIKNNSKNKNHIKKIFSEIWKNKNNSSEEINQKTQNIQPKKSAAQRIQENKRKKNLELIEKRKQKQQERLEAEKNKEIWKNKKIQAENIQSDYETLYPFSGNLSKISPWQNDFSKKLSAEEKQEKFQQISSASSIYKILMSRLPKNIFEKTHWLDDAKRYTVLKEYIKNYLHHDFEYSLETKNQQRHLLHLVNSAWEILLLSQQYKKQNPPKNNTQWTNYYKNAA
mgnify:CR=1 FL=1